MNTKFTKFSDENIFDKVDKLKEELSGFESLFEIEMNKLSNIMEIYNNKKDDSDCEKIKLKIGIMGQVNSGKSSFLNALIFNGENVLPKDCISKTKIITKINYSDTKRIEIEFYTKKEWKEIKNVLIKEGEIKGVKFVKEVFEFINASEYDVDKYINRDNEIFDFQNYDELLEKIKECEDKYNNYRFPIKAMNIYIDDERLKNIEVLDTPGVNDSNFVRKYTIDKCFKYVDIIFFISQAAIFLDDLDVSLISNQIPVESAGNVFLVASKYDNVIIDEGWKFKSLVETDKYIKSRLTNRSRKCVLNYVSNSTPIFMSAMANNLALKEEDKYTDEENYIIKQLNDLWDGFIFNKEKLMFIGNFENIKNKISDKLDIKENLIVKLKEEVERILLDIEDKSKQKIYVIENTEMKYIDFEQEKIKLKSQKIYKGIEELIEKTKDSAVNKKKEMEKQLELDFLTFSEVKVKKKTIRIESEDSNNNIKWYDGLFKKANNEQIDYNFVDYEYVEINEVINDINSFASNADVYLKKMISDIMNFNILAENIIKIIFENLDENNEKFKLNYVKEFIKSSICSIKFLHININVGEYVDIITSKFSDETTGESIEILKLHFKAIMKKIYNEIVEKVDSELQLLMFKLDKSYISIVKYILEIMNNRIESLKNESYHLEKKIKYYKKIINIIDGNSI
ncbi:dynamin family protein [Clostridium saccharobutylicum]|uniref:Dynamin family protein n=1 Tax=Clostridium saccharobutylicum TaxID=169679 RepID=A0A1S8NIH3_CLOSA|nr:dynamin family protein [Clostridium saccharobutylicum]OOM16247.1 dynamin family protein [Clostridium saccharobutylicum]